MRSEKLFRSGMLAGIAMALIVSPPLLLSAYAVVPDPCTGINNPCDLAGNLQICTNNKTKAYADAAAADQKAYDTALINEQGDDKNCDTDIETCEAKAVGGAVLTGVLCAIGGGGPACLAVGLLTWVGGLCYCSIDIKGCYDKATNAYDRAITQANYDYNTAIAKADSEYTTCNQNAHNCYANSGCPQ